MSYQDGEIKPTEVQNLAIRDKLLAPIDIPIPNETLIPLPIDIKTLLQSRSVEGIYDTTDSNICRLNTYTFNRYLIPDKTWITFFAWYLSDGHVTWNKERKGFVVLTLNKERGREAIEVCKEIARRIDRAYHINDRGNNVQLKINSKILAYLMET